MDLTDACGDTRRDLFESREKIEVSLNKQKSSGFWPCRSFSLPVSYTVTDYTFREIYFTTGTYLDLSICFLTNKNNIS